MVWYGLVWFGWYSLVWGGGGPVMMTFMDDFHG